MEAAQKNLKLILISLVLIFLGGFLIFKGLDKTKTPAENFSPIAEESTSSAKPNSEQILGRVSEQFQVLRVIDGDTIEVSGNQKVRLIGINTPETVDPRKAVECFGKEASNETKRLLEGKTVRMEKDVSETDKFGRLLRFVYLQGKDGEVFINDYLVRSGFAYAITYPPDVKFAEVFKEAEAEARSKNLGLWSSCK